MKKLFKIFFVVFALFILVSCDKEEPKEPTLLIDLIGKNQQEITTLFSTYKEDVNLIFEYSYSNTIDTGKFIRYKDPANVGDEIKNGDNITIVLASEKLYLPDLTGMTEEEIITAFENLFENDSTVNVKLEFNYSYPTDENEGVFTSYEGGNEVGSLVVNNTTVKVGISGNYALYPDLTDVNYEDIEDLFIDLFKDYPDVSYTITFESYFEPTLDEGTIIGYAGEIEVNDPILNDTNIVIKRSSKLLILPRLIGLNVDEMKALFLEMNVPLNRLVFIPDFSAYAKPGEFIKYANNRAGDSYDISKNNLFIHYDMRPSLPDLEGLNKKQIEEEFKNTTANVTYEYILDNNNEHDLFAGYKDHEAGDELTTNMDLVIYLYKNDDVNIGDEVLTEKQLFISKYIDSGINNQAIELYNPTDEDIDLSEYYLAIFTGGTLIPNKSIYLEGTIVSKGSFVIVHSSAVDSLRNRSQMQTTLMSFGANSTIQLRKTANNTYIDTIYDLGNISVLLDNEINVRRENITHGRRDFRYLEWMSFVADFYDLVGIHPYTGVEDPIFELIADKTFQEYGMTKVEFLYENDGDTVNFKSLDPRDTTNYGGDSRVRFLIVDTPEIGEAYKSTAQNFTRNMLLSASEIYLQASEPAGLTETYGRHLALVWANIGTTLNPNWRLLNYELLKAGLGEIGIAKTGRYYDYPIFGNRYLYSWAQDADNYAKENKLNLYSGVYKP